MGGGERKRERDDDDDDDDGSSGWADLTLVCLWTASPGPSFKPLGLRSCLVPSHSQKEGLIPLGRDTNHFYLIKRAKDIQPTLDLPTFCCCFPTKKNPKKEDKRRKVVRS